MKKLNQAQEQLLSKINPKIRALIIEVANDVKPMIDEIHSAPKMYQNYYGSYMTKIAILMDQTPYKYPSFWGVVFLYNGADAIGIQWAVKNLTNRN